MFIFLLLCVYIYMFLYLMSVSVINTQNKIKVNLNKIHIFKNVNSLLSWWFISASCKCNICHFNLWFNWCNKITKTIIPMQTHDQSTTDLFKWKWKFADSLTWIWIWEPLLEVGVVRFISGTQHWCVRKNIPSPCVKSSTLNLYFTRRSPFKIHIS